MTWNYRVVKSKDGVYSVGEVYLNEDAKIWGMTKKEYPQGCDVDELIEDLEMMLEDVKRSKHDIIDESTIVLAKMDGQDELDELVDKTSRMTEAELDEYCLRDELDCMDHPEFDFVKELGG
jgi:hypothetical protein